jgi:DNA-binding XRE family transcriptional regulator
MIDCSKTENHFAEKLKSLRLKHKLTQTELGEKLYVSRSTISNYEKEKFEPNIQTLIEMSKLFNISIDELLK